MVWIILAIAVVCIGAYLYFKNKNVNEPKQPQPLPAAAPAVKNGGITEEELVVIAAAIRAFEGEGFTIKSVAPAPVEIMDAVSHSFYRKPEKKAAGWAGAARREHQKRLY